MAEHPVFFFDRCAGKKLPDAIRPLLPAGCVVAHWELYGDAPIQDDVWLRHCAERGWVVVTADASFRKSQLTMTIVRQYGVGWFEINGNASTQVHIAVLELALTRMVDAANTTPRPFCYRIHKTGSITLKPLHPPS